MVAAGHVVEFIAEIAVSIVEVNVEKQFGERDGPNDSHAGREQGFILASGDGKRTSGGCHWRIRACLNLALPFYT